jgi:hypothetical protein
MNCQKEAQKPYFRRPALANCAPQTPLNYFSDSLTRSVLGNPDSPGPLGLLVPTQLFKVVAATLGARTGVKEGREGVCQQAGVFSETQRV